MRLPRVLVNNLGLKPGDELEVVASTATRIVVAKDDRRAALLRGSKTDPQRPYPQTR